MNRKKVAFNGLLHELMEEKVSCSNCNPEHPRYLIRIDQNKILSLFAYGHRLKVELNASKKRRSGRK